MWFEIHQWFEWRWQRSTQLFFSQAFSRTYWTSKQPSSRISIQGETTSKTTRRRTRSISASAFESGSISSLIKRGYHWSDSKCDRFYSTSSHWRVKKKASVVKNLSCDLKAQLRMAIATSGSRSDPYDLWRTHQLSMHEWTTRSFMSLICLYSIKYTKKYLVLSIDKKKKKIKYNI